MSMTDDEIKKHLLNMDADVTVKSGATITLQEIVQDIANNVGGLKVRVDRLEFPDGSTAKPWKPPELTDPVAIAKQMDVPLWTAYTCAQCRRRWNHGINPPTHCPFCRIKFEDTSHEPQIDELAMLLKDHERTLSDNHKYYQTIRELEAEIEDLKDELKKGQTEIGKLDAECTELRGDLEAMNRPLGDPGLCNKCGMVRAEEGEFFCDRCKGKTIREERREETNEAIADVKEKTLRATCNACNLLLPTGEQDELLCTNCRARADVTLEEEPEERTTDPVCPECGDPVEQGCMYCINCLANKLPH